MYPYNLAIAEMQPRPERGHKVGSLGLPWTHNRRVEGEITGSVEGDVAINCDAIHEWSAAAVLSLTDPDREQVSLPLDEFAAGIRARGMYWYHLPIEPGCLPSDRFEADWLAVGDALRRLLRNGARVVIHCENDLARSAMIIARLYIELGCYEKDPFRDLHGFKGGIIPDRITTSYVIGQRAIDPPRPKTTPAATRDRAIGALLGLAVGDALGTTLEFKARDTYPHLTDIVGGGPFRLKPGEWTDDTAMALALAETLQEHDRYDDWPLRHELSRQAGAKFLSGKQNQLARNRMHRRQRAALAGDYPDNPLLFERLLLGRFVAWRERGEYSCNGRCFDIGNTVSAALRNWQRTGNPHAGSTDPQSAGNGSLMRLAPVAVRYWNDANRLHDIAARQSLTTHGAREAVDACVAYANMLACAIAGRPMGEVLAPRKTAYAKAIAEIMAGSWRGKPRSAIRGSGYVVHSLEAALWSVGRSLSFEDAVLTAANLGEDADTTAAIAGQLAGALYGASGIPQRWREKLAWHDRIVGYAEALLPADMRHGG